MARLSQLTSTAEIATCFRDDSIHEIPNERLEEFQYLSGEIADYLALYNKNGDVIVCEVFHCKGSGGTSPGGRVGDAYEVAGQIVKSVILARSPSALKSQLIRRLASGSTICKRTLIELESLIDDAERMRFEFRVCLVQPGISVTTMTDSVSRVLAAA
ncbi:hypothetical protein [Gimesia sp.]|uniref:hypothetical protein n=1 Tax=Gimesia sp. TaxID=2024833 RepID=UPI003A959DF4